MTLEEVREAESALSTEQTEALQKIKKLFIREQNKAHK